MTASTHPSEYENQPRPEFVWFNPKGEMIGIWGFEWGDLFLKAIADYYPEYECEVWQPDLRADKIYTAELQPRLLHKKFPASISTRVKRFRITHETYSSLIIEEICKQDIQGTIFMLPAKMYTYWLDRIIKSIRNANILYYNFLNSRLMLPSPINTYNPLKAINRWLINREKTKWLKRVKHLLTTNDNSEAISEIRKKNRNITIYYFLWGLALDFWKPVLKKQEARRSLGIPKDLFVIVLSQRLVPEYQIDKFIEVMSRVKPKREFVCYITGHGTKNYERHLRELAGKYKVKEIVNFVGFVTDDKLRSLLISADLFATLPIMFAGSGGAAKAMAVGCPVLHVNMGYTYEFLKEHNAGEYVGPQNYDEWVEKLALIIDGKPIKTIPREIIEKNFNWKSTADSIQHAIQNLDRETL